MRFIEHFDYGHKEKDYKKIWPIVLASVLGAILILGTVLFFLLRPSRNITPEIVLYTAQNRWAVSDQAESAENKVWLQSNDIVIKSASLYNGNNEKVADFAEDANNNMVLYTIIGVPVDKAQELEYYAVCNTKSDGTLYTNNINLKVVDEFPDTYYDSEEKTDRKLDKLLNTDKYSQKTVEERSVYLRKQLEKLAEQDPQSGDPYIVKDSITYDEETKNFSFVEAAGTYCYVDLDGENKEDRAAYSADNDYGNFDASYNKDAEGDAIILSAIYETEQENIDYYGSLCDDINDNTPLDCTLEMATLDNLRTKLADNEFIVIECHGYLNDLFGVTVPMFSCFGSAEDYELDDALRADIANHRICKEYLSVNDTVGYRYVITPLFFEYYYGKDGLKDSIVHLGSCEGFGDNLKKQNSYLSYSFINSGASAVVGHINSVYTAYDRAILSTELNSLINNNTISQALKEAENSLGSNDVLFMNKYGSESGKQDAKTHIPAYNAIHGDGSARLNINLSQDTVEPTSQPETQYPTGKGSEKVDLTEFVSDKPYTYAEYKLGSNGDIKLYITDADEDSFSFRINDRKGDVIFTDTFTDVPLEDDFSANVRFNDNLGLEYIVHFEFVDNRIFMKITYNSSKRYSGFTLEGEGWLIKSGDAYPQYKAY
ncbi:MAG: hypothetical protein ACI4RM_07330 [Ruminococcus sp.]